MARELKSHNYAIQMEHGTVVGYIKAILNVWQKYYTKLFKKQQTIDGDDRIFTINDITSTNLTSCKQR